MLYLQSKSRVEIHGVYEVGFPEPSWKTSIRPSSGWNSEAILADNGNALAWLYNTARQQDIFALPIVACQWYPEYAAVLD